LEREQAGGSGWADIGKLTSGEVLCSTHEECATLCYMFIDATDPDSQCNPCLIHEQRCLSCPEAQLLAPPCRAACPVRGASRPPPPGLQGGPVWPPSLAVPASPCLGPLDAWPPPVPSAQGQPLAERGSLDQLDCSFWWRFLKDLTSSQPIYCMLGRSWRPALPGGPGEFPVEKRNEREALPQLREPDHQPEVTKKRFKFLMQ